MKTMTHATAPRSLPTLVETIAQLPLTRWISVMRERRHLSDLEPHLLKDIGVSQADRDREVVRPFWDVTSRS